MEFSKSGTCAKCGKDFPPTIRYCGCDAESVERRAKEIRAAHLKTWIKEKHEEIVRATNRIRTMEEELKNLI